VLVILTSQKQKISTMSIESKHQGLDAALKLEAQFKRTYDPDYIQAPAGVYTYSVCCLRIASHRKLFK